MRRIRSWISLQPLRRQHVFGPGVLDAGGLEQDAPLGLELGIEDVDLHQEAVELGFRQRIGAFLLQRVLGGQHMERRGQVVARAGDR